MVASQVRRSLIAIIIAWVGPCLAPLLGCHDPAAPLALRIMYRASLKVFLPDGIAWPYESPILSVTVGDSTLRTSPGQFSRCVVWDGLLPAPPHFAVHFANATDSVWADAPNFPADQHRRFAWATLGELMGPGNGIWAGVQYTSQECGDSAGVAP